jgi:hypothetical protein
VTDRSLAAIDVKGRFKPARALTDKNRAVPAARVS